MIETPALNTINSNDYQNPTSHVSAAAVLSMQTNGPTFQQNEELHTSPDFTETSFPVESSITPTESLDRDDNQEVIDFQ